MELCSVTVTALLFVLFFSEFLSVDTHSVQYLYTFITPGTHFPEFTAVGLVDEEQFVYYDSNINEWKQKINTNDSQYQKEMNRMKKQQDRFEDIVATVVNPTEGNHTLQRMYGCEHADDNTTRGYDLYGYDGEDFFSLNLTTGSWTEANDKAESFIKKWDPVGRQAKHWKDYLNIDCIDWLYKVVSNGTVILERKVRPEVSVFQKHSPSPEVVCHATGFFPKAVMITWQKDRKDVYEDVELRETLPNQDGSFQKRSILKVPAEELQKHNYTCVVHHSSLEKELVLEVPKGGGSDRWWIGVIVVVVLGLVVLVAVTVTYRCKKSKRHQPVGTRNEDEDEENIEMRPVEQMEPTISDQSEEMQTVQVNPSATVGEVRQQITPLL